MFAVFLFALVRAQNTPKFSYQAVVRNASNELVVNDSVSVRIQFYNHEVSGNAVYSELHHVTSNSNGLISLLVGEGEEAVGDLSQVTWQDAVASTEITLRGGYSVSDVKPVTAVPLAFYAERIPLQALEEHLGSTNLVSADALRDTLFHYVTASGLSDTLTSYVARPELRDSLERYAAAAAGLLDTLSHYVTTSGLSDTLTSYVARPELRDSLERYAAAGLLDTLFHYVTASGLSDTLTSYVARPELRDSLERYAAAAAGLLDTLSHYVTTSRLSDSLANYVTFPALSDGLDNRPTRSELSDSLAHYVPLADYEGALAVIMAALADLRSVTTSMEEWTVPAVPTNLFLLSAEPLSGRASILYINGVCVSARAYHVIDRQLTYMPDFNGGKELEEGDRIQFYYHHK